MDRLIIALSFIGMIFLAVLAYVWHRTDWEEIDKANEIFFDKNGEHAYYDHFKNRKR